jgi:hypothetical protein
MLRLEWAEKTTLRLGRVGKLPDKDSNLDKQSQSLSYYRYTIGQSMAKDTKDAGGEQLAFCSP